ncbi:MAG: hypothetical protein EOO40_04665, partial [Deltaproteobacteria bacterium]
MNSLTLGQPEAASAWRSSHRPASAEDCLSTASNGSLPGASQTAGDRYLGGVSQSSEQPSSSVGAGPRRPEQPVDRTRRLLAFYRTSPYLRPALQAAERANAPLNEDNLFRWELAGWAMVEKQHGEAQGRQAARQIAEARRTQARELHVSRLPYPSLPHGLGKLTSLHTLHITDCPNLDHLPGTLGNLKRLLNLDLESCTTLKQLPISLGLLSALQTLSLRACIQLSGLPTNFGGLARLQVLDLVGCEGLQRLPEDLGSLTALQTVALGGAENLLELPDSTG